MTRLASRRSSLDNSSSRTLACRWTDATKGLRSRRTYHLVRYKWHARRRRKCRLFTDAGHFRKARSPVPARIDRFRRRQKFPEIARSHKCRRAALGNNLHRDFQVYRGRHSGASVLTRRALSTSAFGCLRLNIDAHVDARYIDNERRRNEKLLKMIAATTVVTLSRG